MKNYQGILLAVAAAVVPFLSSARTAGAGALNLPRSEPLRGFDAQVAQAVTDWRAPGLAIAVVKDGKTIFAKGYGVRAIGSPETVDVHTLFAIGSTTKAMTAAALAMLVDEKKVAWDDPVTKHLPWFALKDPYVTRELTLRDLLTHRAGLPNADFLWYGQNNSPRTILERLRMVEPAYSLRSSFIYQNIMYAAAGAVIEAVSGTSWPHFIETRIFRPLGMTDSIATAADLGSHENRAEPHFIIEAQVARIENASVDGVAPAGSIWSSVADMSRWITMLLRNGVADDGARLLSGESVTELFRPQTMVTREAFYPTAELTHPNWTTYGFGWFQQDYAGRKVDFHTGSIDGMVAISGLIRSEGIGVYVLANLDHAELRHALMLTAFDRLLGRPARDWSHEFQALYGRLQKEAVDAEKKAQGEPTPGTHPSLPLEAYAGRYSDSLAGDVFISLDPANHSLRARYGSAFEGPLNHRSFDTFDAGWAARWRGTSTVSFLLDANGHVAEVQLMGARFKRTPDVQ